MKHICVTDRHDMTLAVKVALNLNTTNQPNLAPQIYMPMRSPMRSFMGQIEPEHRELFSFEFEKIVESDFVYTLASTNINQSAPNLVKMYLAIRSRMDL